MVANRWVLNAMKMTVMGSDANLTTRLIKEGGVHVPTEDITLPFWKETYTHIHTQNYQSKTRQSPQPAYSPIRADEKAYKHTLYLAKNELLP